MFAYYGARGYVRVVIFYFGFVVLFDCCSG